MDGELSFYDRAFTALGDTDLLSFLSDEINAVTGTEYDDSILLKIRSATI